jgi:hypothetical protein
MKQELFTLPEPWVQPWYLWSLCFFSVLCDVDHSLSFLPFILVEYTLPNQLRDVCICLCVFLYTKNIHMYIQIDWKTYVCVFVCVFIYNFFLFFVISYRSSCHYINFFQIAVGNMHLRQLKICHGRWYTSVCYW